MDQHIGLSLVIPTNNRAALVVETVEMAFRQSVPFAEIIVVDDGSEDDTLERLERFGDRIKVIACRKVGVQVARNVGVDAATSEYVTFCDSDDLLQFRFVEVIGGWLAAHPQYDSVYSNYQSFRGKKLEADILSGAPTGFFEGAVFDGDFIEHIPDLYPRTVYFQPLMPTGCTVRKRFYQEIGGFDPAMDGMPSEDWEYTLRAIEAGKTAICIKPLVQIRHHNGNDSRNLLHRGLGEIEVLKYALEHHATATRYREEILQGIKDRTDRIFYESFRSHEWSVASLVFPRLENRPRTFRFKIKSMMMSAYMRFNKAEPKSFQPRH